MNKNRVENAKEIKEKRFQKSFTVNSQKNEQIEENEWILWIEN